MNPSAKQNLPPSPSPEAAVVADPLATPSLLRFIWAHRREFAPGLAFAVSRIVVIAPFPLIFRHIVDKLMPARNVAGILEASAVMVGLLIVHHWLSIRGAVGLGHAVTRIILQLRARIFDKIQYLSFAYLDQEKTGRLLSKYAFDTQKVDGVLMPILNSFVPDSVYSALTFSVLVSMNWQLAFVLVVMLPIVAVARAYYFKRFQRKHETSRLAVERLTGLATEFFGALRLVRSYGEERQARRRLHESNEQVAQSRVDLINVSSSFASFSFASVTVLSLVVVAGGAMLVIYGQISTGEVIAFVAGVPSLVNPIQMFAQISDQYFIGQEAYNSIKELADSPYVEKWHGTRTLAPVRGRVEFDAVSFNYSDTSRGALRDFSLDIRAGERLALVGPSGAGKSTIANLLLGLYAPTAGVIRIDGVPQAELDMRWLRQNAAIVMQESILLTGTVEDNIRFARPEASDEEVRQAARLANAEEFISRMPEGFQTVIGERGAMLSGGQRQRLSIARAVLRNPALLILDEPTSALDYESERLIQEALEKLEGGRTVITIAHRLSTIRHADRVVVLQEGRIVEEGTFEELAARGAYFAALLAAQKVAAG